MAVLRSNNWLGQQRVDVPHLRAVESSLCADFDVLAGNIMAGLAPVVVSGFDTITTGAIGQPATNVQVNVAGAIVMHTQATDSGTFIQIPSTRAAETLNSTNARVKGSFTSSAPNYVGIDLVRTADTTTADLVQFLNPVTNLESPKDVPLGRTFDYVIYISTQDFSATPNICPIAVITTDGSNNVSAITDARNMFYRLGSGGSNPNALYTYPWPGGRTELGTNADFSAADKKINSQKDWMNAIMTRLWEVGGGEHWYSNTGWQNVQLLRNGTSVFVSTGDYFEWVGSNLHWQSLRVAFSNSTGWYNDIADQTTDSAGLTDLADGECIYVDLDRTTNRTGGTALTAKKTFYATLGSPIIPGSRMVIAWRIGTNIFTRGNSYYIGATFNVATTTTVGTVKLHDASLTPATPVVYSDGSINVANGIVGLDANKTATIAATGGTAALTVSGGGGVGVNSTGGPNGWGGTFVGGATNGGGVSGTSQGTGIAVQGTANGTGIGVKGIGGGTGVVGTGGVGGIGVQGTGGTSGAGGDFTGGNTAPAIQAHVSGTSNTGPLVKYLDTTAKGITYVDFTGYFNGPGFQWTESWVDYVYAYAAGGPSGATLPNSSRWTYSSPQASSQGNMFFNGGSMTFGNLVAGAYGSGYVALASTNAITQFNVANNVDHLIVSLEFDWVSTGDAFTTIYAGLANGLIAHTATQFWGFKWTGPSGTEFHGMNGGNVTGGSADITLTGVTSGVLKMIYCGSQTPWGVFNGTLGANVGMLYFFQNNVLKGSTQCIMNNNNSIHIALEAYEVATGTSFPTIGPFRLHVCNIASYV